MLLRLASSWTVVSPRVLVLCFLGTGRLLSFMHRAPGPALVHCHAPFSEHPVSLLLPTGGHGKAGGGAPPPGDGGLEGVELDGLGRPGGVGLCEHRVDPRIAAEGWDDRLVDAARCPSALAMEQDELRIRLL